jgi:hypothetical protein
MGIRGSLPVNIRSSLATLNVHSTAEQRSAKNRTAERHTAELNTLKSEAKVL